MNKKIFKLNENELLKDNLLNDFEECFNIKKNYLYYGRIINDELYLYNENFINEIDEENYLKIEMKYIIELKENEIDNELFELLNDIIINMNGKLNKYMIKLLEIELA